MIDKHKYQREITEITGKLWGYNDTHILIGYSDEYRFISNILDDLNIPYEINDAYNSGNKYFMISLIDYHSYKKSKERDEKINSILNN